jgi:hypothetical protein
VRRDGGAVEELGLHVGENLTATADPRHGPSTPPCMPPKSPSVIPRGPGLPGCHERDSFRSPGEAQKAVLEQACEVAALQGVAADQRLGPHRAVPDMAEHRLDRTDEPVAWAAEAL